MNLLNSSCPNGRTLARKLLIALWRYVGTVHEGAQLKASAV